VGDEELIHLSGTQTAAEMWKQLRNTKEPKGIFGVVAERQKLLQIIPSESTPIIEHIAVF
jgi:hypothetical protein